MDQRTVLAHFDEQIRRHPQPDPPDGYVEHEVNVTRALSAADGWIGVTWSALDAATADSAIAAQIDRFADLSRPWEWKHYSCDQPSDLPDRLRASGFAEQPAEALLVVEIADLRLDPVPAAGIGLHAVVDEQDVAAVGSVHDEVFGGHHEGLGRTLLAGLASHPPTTAAVLAMAGGKPIAEGRVEFAYGTDFASLWGGATLPEWRGRGVFGSLVAYRAALAAANGFRYLQVDATPASRPILENLGFVQLATTTPFIYPGG